MSILSPVNSLLWRQSPRYELETRVATPAPSESMFVGMQANIPHWGRDDYDVLAREGYSRIPLVYAIISAISTSAAEARVRPMITKGTDTAELDTGPLAQLLKQPNPRQSWYSFGVQYHVVMQYSGNCFIFKRRNAAGVPVQLRILRTGRMSIVPGPNGEPIRYEHRIDGHDYPIRPEDIIHVKRDDPLDDWFGLSPLHVLARTSQVKVEMQKVTWGAFHNGGMMGGILTMDRELDDDEPEEYRRQWRRQFTGVQAGNIAVFGASLKYQKVAMDLDKMALKDLNQMTDVEICGVFQTPPSVVYTYVGMQRATFNNSVEENRKWWENCLGPEVRLLVEGLEIGLRPDFGEDWTLDPDTSQIRALQDDQDATHARVREDWNAGIITRDEARTGIGFDPVGGDAGDMFRIPNNVVEKTADEINNPPPPPPPMPVVKTLLPSDGQLQAGQQQDGQLPSADEAQPRAEAPKSLPEGRAAPEFVSEPVAVEAN